MKKWEMVVDQLVQEVIGNGDVSHLPGAGKPLHLDDDSLTPAELRAAHKILGDHNVMPDWISSRKLLDQAERNLQKQILGRAARYIAGKRTTHPPGQAKLESLLEEDWKRSRDKFLEQIERYNRDVLNQNLKVPRGVPHKPLLDGEDMIERALLAQFGESNAMT